MIERAWPDGAATGIGSMPGADPAETAAVVLGELPEFPHLPELPGRGVGADILGRTAGLLVDIAVDVVPSGYRVSPRPGLDHRRAVDLMRWDLDAFEEALQRSGSTPAVVKTQVAGPWTLAAGIELARGHRVLTDRGALREFAASLSEGLDAHVRELAERTGARVVVQFDEPTLPDVLAGALSTPSGYGTVRSVPAPEARDLLAEVIGAAERSTGQPVIVHCCATRPPVSLLRSAGAGALALDGTTLDGAPASLLDELGEAWDSGVSLLLGLVPALEPDAPPRLRDLAGPALNLADRLGFGRDILTALTLPTPSCGLAGADLRWMRRTLTLTRELGRAFAEPPEGW
ncbi:methionine synthase [Amycolatopsis antarctica]|uniref:Methionine synthase n=1 Tax=Amycolatopsis antarctica TaxID=1854586 RepID=A0A263D918_9PSEU|nr:methionine synthase [Amycolatopsis antarctica]OZM74037.1 methionine synthase [Amycolatopsis antarctica]